MLLAYGGLTYGLYYGVWVPLAGSASICLFAWLAWGAEWTTWTGMRMSGKDARLSFVLFLVCLGGAKVLIDLAAREVGVERVSIAAPLLWRPELLHHVGQTLNEEIILGAVLLNVSLRKFERARLIGISVALATVFAFLHFAFYWCRSASSFNEGALSIGSLLAVFGGGVLRHNLILTSGHIGYSWALHLALNVVLFAGYRSSRGVLLSEPQLFDNLLGTPTNIAVISIALLTSLVLGREKLFRRRLIAHAEV